jgi:hypothetical protein
MMDVGAWRVWACSHVGSDVHNEATRTRPAKEGVGEAGSTPTEAALTCFWDANHTAAHRDADGSGLSAG